MEAHCEVLLGFDLRLCGGPLRGFEPLPVPAKIGSELGPMFDHGVTRPLCVLPICAAVLRDVTVLWPVLQRRYTQRVGHRGNRPDGPPRSADDANRQPVMMRTTSPTDLQFAIRRFGESLSIPASKVTTRWISTRTAGTRGRRRRLRAGAARYAHRVAGERYGRTTRQRNRST